MHGLLESAMGGGVGEAWGGGLGAGQGRREGRGAVKGKQSVHLVPQCQGLKSEGCSVLKAVRWHFVDAYSG